MSFANHDPQCACDLCRATVELLQTIRDLRERLSDTYDKGHRSQCGNGRLKVAFPECTCGLGELIVRSRRLAP